MPLKFEFTVSLLFFVYISTLSGRLIHFHHCRPPTTCTDIYTCQNSSLVYSVKRIYCGFSGNAPKICCLLPSDKTSPTSSPGVFRGIENLVNHKNFNLLPIDTCGVVASRFRITSGANTSPGEFPWMALIAYKTGNSTTMRDFKCGGTLITKNYVLTAAHCIENSTILGVRLGEYNILTQIDCDDGAQNCEPPVQDLLINKINVHPFYDPTTFINDIALIKLTATANYSYGNVKPICLPFDELLQLNLEGLELTVAGWGATEEGDKSMTLRKVSVPVMPHESCQKLYETMKPITKNQLCAGADKGRDSCAGDSGGPLKRIDFIDNTPRYVQYGIVSFGPTQCGIGNRPGIYTNIQKYMKWILDNLE